MKWSKSRNSYIRLRSSTLSAGRPTSLRRAISSSAAGRTVPSRWTWSSIFGSGTGVMAEASWSGRKHRRSGAVAANRGRQALPIWSARGGLSVPPPPAGRVWFRPGHRRIRAMASYTVNPAAVAKAEELIDARQYVLASDWGEVQPKAEAQNWYLDAHAWEEYAAWHLGLTEGANDETKARYAFVYGDFRRIHRSGIIACHYRAAEWRHKEIELAAHELLQYLDRKSGLIR